MASATILSGTRPITDSGLEYSLAPDAAVILMADGSARILDMGDRFYSVPAVAAIFLEETLRHGPAAAVKRVAAEYDAPEAQVETDLRQFLATLVERGILRNNNQEHSQQPESSRAALRIAGMLSRAVRWLPLKAQASVLLTAARLCLATLGWTRTIAAWRQKFPVRQESPSPEKAEALARAIDDAVCSGASWNMLGVACKERAMACWALARMAGLPAELVIGVELFPLSGHCWCEAGPYVVSDHAESCAAYLPALRYQ